MHHIYIPRLHKGQTLKSSSLACRYQIAIALGVFVEAESMYVLVDRDVLYFVAIRYPWVHVSVRYMF